MILMLSANLQAQANFVESVTLSSTTLVGGQTTLATAKLNQHPVTGAPVLYLTSSDPTVAVVAATVGYVPGTTLIPDDRYVTFVVDTLPRTSTAPVTVTIEEHSILNAFAKLRTSMDRPELETKSGVTNAPRGKHT